MLRELLIPIIRRPKKGFQVHTMWLERTHWYTYNFCSRTSQGRTSKWRMFTALCGRLLRGEGGSPWLNLISNYKPFARSKKNSNSHKLLTSRLACCFAFSKKNIYGHHVKKDWSGQMKMKMSNGKLLKYVLAYCGVVEWFTKFQCPMKELQSEVWRSRSLDGRRHDEILQTALMMQPRANQLQLHRWIGERQAGQWSETTSTGPTTSIAKRLHIHISHQQQICQRTRDFDRQEEKTMIRQINLHKKASKSRYREMSRTTREKKSNSRKLRLFGSIGETSEQQTSSSVMRSSDLLVFHIVLALSSVVV